MPRKTKEQLSKPFLEISHTTFTKFVALVVEQEREECAKIADAWDRENKLSNYGGCIALRIRARGEV